MSTCLTNTEGVKARKKHRCCLCGELINIGELHDTRTGVEPGNGFWKMRMHPECHAYEQSPARPVDPEWYENVSESAFDRADARAHAAKTYEAKPAK